MQKSLNTNLAIDKLGYIVYICTMYFLLHHSTGALMLDAKNLNEVLSWSERQLGPRAGLVSVLQLDSQSCADSVEKSGTGIHQAKTDGCEAKLSFMADSVQRVSGLDHEGMEPFQWHRTVDLRSCKSSVH